MNTWINELGAWLETTSMHQTMQTVEWVVPAVQTIHILAIAVVFASSLALALRAFSVAGLDWSPSQWGTRLNGWIVGALIVLLVSGILMISGEPGRSLNNSLFQAKMVLLLLAIILFFLLSRAFRRLNQLGQRASGGVRLLAILLMAVWVMIIFCGRWIAYT